MDKIKSYQDLIVWQKSVLLVTDIYALTKNFPQDERFGITSQLNRAAVSVPTNIAEGWGRETSKNYLQFLRISRGSVMEVQTLLIISKNLNYISEEKFDILRNKTEEVGKIMWDKCGMGRNAKGLTEAIAEIKNLREEFWKDVRIPGIQNEMNLELEKAMRVADFIELGELMCKDALHRNESCGGHFREEYQTEDGEAKRDDENFTYAAAWEMKSVGEWELHKEDLNYQVVHPSQRSYK